MGRWRRWCLGLALGVCLLSWGYWRWPRPGPLDPSQQRPGAAVVMRGELLTRLQPLAGGGCRGQLALDLPYQGRTELLLNPCASSAQAWREGWRLELSGALQRPQAAAHPLLGDGGARLARQGVFSRLLVAEARVLDQRQGPVARLRQHLADRLVAAAGPEQGPLLAALVMGSAVVELPSALQANFRAAGLSHALAASGFHLTVLLGVVMALGRRAPAPLRLCAGLGAMLVFLLLAGPQPSVLRALVMGVAALAIKQTGEKSRPLGLLGLSLGLLLLWQPAWLFDVGFQLSAAATAGLILTAPRLQQRLEAQWPGPWAPAVAAALAVPMAASLWTLPLQLLHFGVVPLYAVPANGLASPLVTLLTLGAMGSALLVLIFPWLVGPAAALLHGPGQVLLSLVAGFAQLPLAQLLTGRPAPWLVVLFSLGLLPWLLPLRRWRLAGLGLITAAVVVQLHGLLADGLLLVHQPAGSLLLARHQGRGALVSNQADANSCRRAARLREGLGVPRFDWLVLLDPVAPEDPGCWQRLTAHLAVLPQGHLASPGLGFTSLDLAGGAAVLEVGAQRWGLFPHPAGELPELTPPGLRGIWLGHPPRRGRQGPWAQLAQGREVWVSGLASRQQPRPTGWHFTGLRGFLQTP